MFNQLLMDGMVFQMSSLNITQTVFQIASSKTAIIAYVGILFAILAVIVVSVMINDMKNQAR